MDCEIRASGSGSTTSKAADSHDHVGKFALKKQSNSKLRGRREDPPDVRFSKILSYILRHGATKEGLKVRTDGFVRVDELLRRPKLKELDLDTLRSLVAANAKQRFAIKEANDSTTGETGVLWIRANQGHSLEVDDLELERIEDAQECPLVIHGTFQKHWQAIRKEGLKVMNRHHIHCTSALYGQHGVTSGMRPTCDLFIFVNAGKAMEDGIVFERSANGVILTKGKSGTLSPDYFQTQHNVSGDYQIPDAVLTKKGRQQAKDLDRATRETVQKDVELIVSSPLRRTIQTTLDGYPHAVARLGGKSKILLLPSAQECNALPCDTGSSRRELEKDPEFDGLDMSLLTDDWISKAGQYAATEVALQARARHLRRFLRSRPEKKIVLVAHGDILRYVVKGRYGVAPWANAEVRMYKFAEEEDDAAILVQIKTEAKEGREEPTSSEAQH
ncbi:MAG: hypothetical protein CYPHOPRED_005450 [Cyphobasidiales sp. Tagirdzhanova-0007]|nr:MAG: hypothetical protein CYPHOPRED_005450 [Cyphobasidiales sp. Tagirdzhanova-0007]